VKTQPTWRDASNTDPRRSYLRIGAWSCAAGALFIALITVSSPSSLSRLLPSRRTSTSQTLATFPAAHEPLLDLRIHLPPTLPPPDEMQPARTRAVAIPPILTPLLASAPRGMPAIVTPTSMSSPEGGDRPILVRQPSMPAVPIPAVLRLPAGQGPFPAVIMLHGCGGPFSGMPAWAYRLNAWGYAVLMPDSMTPRGVKTVCDPAEQPKVTPWDRVGDVGASATWLRAQPEIDPARIAVLGFSHGGMTAALSVQTPYAGMRLRAAIDYYGPCVEPRLHGSVPLLVLAGEADDWANPAAECRNYGLKLRLDQPFQIHTYPGAHHGFDSGSTTPVTYSGHILQHDPAAAEDSFVRVHTFLDLWVRPQAAAAPLAAP
jgi:dienelactone hydrolase